MGKDLIDDFIRDIFSGDFPQIMEGLGQIDSQAVIGKVLTGSFQGIFQALESLLQQILLPGILGHAAAFAVGSFPVDEISEPLFHLFQAFSCLH